MRRLIIPPALLAGKPEFPNNALRHTGCAHSSSEKRGIGTENIVRKRNGNIRSHDWDERRKDTKFTCGLPGKAAQRASLKVRRRVLANSEDRVQGARQRLAVLQVRYPTANSGGEKLLKHSGKGSNAQRDV